jgi:hypothetical protein
MGWVGHVTGMGGMVLVGKYKGKKPLGRPSYGRENKIHIKEILWEGMHWFNLVQVRERLQAVLNTVMKFQIP